MRQRYPSDGPSAGALPGRLAQRWRSSLRTAGLGFARFGSNAADAFFGAARACRGGELCHSCFDGLNRLFSPASGLFLDAFNGIFHRACDAANRRFGASHSFAWAFSCGHETSCLDTGSATTKHSSVGSRSSTSPFPGRSLLKYDLLVDPLAGLEREALRVYRRYATEVVEAFGLCPWAERARRDGRVAERVISNDDPHDLAPSLAAVAILAEDCCIEVALLIYPRFYLSRLDFEEFVARLRDADSARYALGEAPFAAAAFHPDAAPDVGDAERLIPFLRRTPDPTIQLVRRAALERVRARTPMGTEFVDIHLLTAHALAANPEPSLRRRIAEDNLDTVRNAGVEALTARLLEIQADRRASYARLGFVAAAG
jgi:hypothetical protein